MGIAGSSGSIKWNFVPFAQERGKVELRHVGVATIVQEGLPTLLAFTVKTIEGVDSASDPRAAAWVSVLQRDLVNALALLRVNPHLEFPVGESTLVVSVRRVYASSLVLVFSVRSGDTAPGSTGDFLVEPGHVQDVFSTWVASMGVDMKAWKVDVLGVPIPVLSM